MILIIDNYDSFTYNLLQFCGSVDPDIKVVRNDKITIDEIKALDPKCIILSPGPGYPKDAGICEEVIRELKGEYPILGVCLGHQAICEAFSAKITHAVKLMHGKNSNINVDTTCRIFKGMPKVVKAARYHSLIADKNTIPECLKVVATDEMGEVMAVKHTEYEIYGVQFHPESILTSDGLSMIRNFINEERLMIVESIKKLVEGQELEYEEAAQVMDEMMSGKASNAQMATFLTALKMKGETIDEITACAQVMRDKAIHINPEKDVLDIVGTGGDGTGTFNISTTSAFVIAAAGVAIAKHGNRSMSSKSGAADCLEALGINITIPAEKSKEILDKADICFMFAQGYHSSMKYVGPVRKQMGIRNVFNILGPLTNPANANMQVMGVYSESLVEPLAKVLSNLGVERGIVLYGCDGMDEATVTAPTKICEINNGKFKTYLITPESVGLKTYSMVELIGGDGKENAEITRQILTGKLKGAKRDIVLLNSALGIYVGGKAKSIEEGIKVAAEIIDSGKAYAKMEEFAKLSNQ